MSRIWALSYGGGVNSTALAILLLKQRQPFYAVFADTGAERQVTLDYTYETFFPYLREHGIACFTVKGEQGQGIIQYCIDNEVIPFRAWRWCTDKFKARPIENFVGNDTHAIGIDAGETHRAKRFKGDKMFPLIDAELDREGCRKVILDAGIPEPVKSGCWCCPFSRVHQIVALPDCRFDLATQMEATQEKVLLWHDKPVSYWRERARAFREQGLISDIGWIPEEPCECYDG